MSRYVPLALAPLIAKDQPVSTVVKTPELITTRTITRPFLTKPQFHDKLVLIEQNDDTKKYLLVRLDLPIMYRITKILRI